MSKVVFEDNNKQIVQIDKDRFSVVEVEVDPNCGGQKELLCLRVDKSILDAYGNEIGKVLADAFDTILGSEYFKQKLLQTTTEGVIHE